VGVKAALVPLHAWLPRAMVAPAPVSALLHAVAVVKAGAFGIVRIIYDVFGVEYAAALGVTVPLAVLAGVTIIYGSVRALFQEDLKRRLAFSTVSQVSYITLGVAIAGPIATIGGLVHLVHQGFMKITLFFCAGNYAETLGVHTVTEMRGIGRRMPWTTAAFTIAAFGMIGVPPVVGFVSKWYLGLGALEAGHDWAVYVLAGSGLLNAAYFLPLVRAAWFEPPPEEWPRERSFGRKETAWLLLLPPVATALAALVWGLFASMPGTPLDWVQFIAARKYAP
jgi:multicomponent Na+:H+ antiporter subunit D